MEVSAKTGENIKQLFDEMIRGTIIKLINLEKKENNLNNSINLSFLDKETITQKNNFCC